MQADFWGAWATLVVGALGMFQWIMTTMAVARQRDRELYEWGARVLSVMARIESACAPLTGDVDPHLAMTLTDEASALIDQGRLFFPNVPDHADPAGLRVRILDEALRACYVARHLAQTGVRDASLRERVWQARRRFITLLQKEMGPSLRRSKPVMAGDSIPKNPLSWGG